MRDVCCKLIKQNYKQNEIGTFIPDGKPIELEIPIIRVEDIYAKEFYEANEKGYKPSLRLIISPLNYDDEEELIYMGKVYSIIRTQEVEADELAIICGRKLKNVK